LIQQNLIVKPITIYFTIQSSFQEENDKDTQW